MTTNTFKTHALLFIDSARQQIQNFDDQTAKWIVILQTSKLIFNIKALINAYKRPGVS